MAQRLKKLVAYTLLSLSLVVPFGFCLVWIAAAPGRDVYGLLAVNAVVWICAYVAWQAGWWLLSKDNNSRLSAFNRRLHQVVGWAALAIGLVIALDYGTRPMGMHGNESAEMERVALVDFLPSDAGQKREIYIWSVRAEDLADLKTENPQLSIRAWDDSHTSPCGALPGPGNGVLQACFSDHGYWGELHLVGSGNLLRHVAEVHWWTDGCSGNRVFVQTFGKWHLVGRANGLCH
jgi:hypothetical protein